ncbi:MAG: 3-methyladenine DNA glycosylase [Gordonia sp. (in: high G+C Gram-positive bacteria)]|uniref:3-methyladenine DNA glycosylase n=1 Tax=Gordonia sp. (in: high G+C Gram-positive bacteria) TaxID=84139 RepID=UPI003C73964F
MPTPEPATGSPATDSPAAGAPTLAREEWQTRAQAHRERIEALIGPYLQARSQGRKHPVIDFLFTYYSARPKQVTRWHPGYGVALAQAHRYGGLRGYRVDADGTARVSIEHLRDRRPLLTATLRLARATAGRPARFGCFGLHEWAMVYRVEETRHELPLRLGAAGTDAVVERQPLRCTHFDAFRFFTEPAAGLNATALTRATAIDNEQPGCLHATMDLYRFCLKLTPLIPSELLADCFELALCARELDMRASPYDLSQYGYWPVTIETADGRAQYVREQSAIADRGERARAALITACEDLLRLSDLA